MTELPASPREPQPEVMGIHGPKPGGGGTVTNAVALSGAPDCLPVKNVYRVLSHGHAKRIPRDERCPEPKCPNRWTVLVELATDPPTGYRFCDDHWAAAQIAGPCDPQ